LKLALLFRSIVPIMLMCYQITTLHSGFSTTVPRLLEITLLRRWFSYTSVTVRISSITSIKNSSQRTRHRTDKGIAAGVSLYGPTNRSAPNTDR